MKFLWYGYLLYTAAYFVVWLHCVFNSKILTGSVLWLMALIITSIYENSKYGKKNLFLFIGEIRDILVGLVIINFLTIFSPLIVFGREILLMKNRYYVANNKKIIKKIVAIIFLLAVFVGYAHLINVYTGWALLSVMTLNFSIIIFVITGAVIFIYMLVGMPFVTMWLTRWENDYILIKLLSRVVVALHMFLIFPLVWLTE